MKSAAALLITAAILAIAAAIEMACDRYRPRTAGWLRLAVILVLVAAFGLALTRLAGARDLGQWETGDPKIREWYQSLIQPDNAPYSCCGEADAYWCDVVHVRDAKTFCSVTDTRDDAPLGRQHVAIGTEFEIPPRKLKWDNGNPTGHVIVFLTIGGAVLCFVQNGGV